jgi:hypothetical protein
MVGRPLQPEQRAVEFRQALIRFRQKLGKQVVHRTPGWYVRADGGGQLRKKS